MNDWFVKMPAVEMVGWSVLVLVLLGLLIAIFSFCLKRIPAWRNLQNLEAEKRVGLKIEIIKTGASILGGMFFILTIVVAFLNYRVTQEKHTTDLFTKAIEQLGGKTLEVRLGGIYALERIARDSEKDHGPIMEVLTAYVRANAPWPPEEFEEARKKRPWAKERPGEKPKEKDASPTGIPSGNEKPIQATRAELQKVIPALDADIQAVLTVIGRRSRTFRNGESQRLNLTKTDLRNANLSKAHLGGAILSGAHLEGAYLWNARLEGASLMAAHLEVSVLEYAHLEKADLRHARLNGAKFKGARLDGADLLWSSLEGANLDGVEGLTKEQIGRAIADKKTKLPYYLE